MDRREFLQRVAALGLAAGVGKIFTFPPELLAMAPESRPEPVLAQIQRYELCPPGGRRGPGPGGHEKICQPQ